MSRRAALAAGTAALVAGCTVGPSYHVPDLPAVPARYAEPAAAGPGDDRSAWWTRFNDPALTALVTRALKGSPDVAAAAARVRQARLQEAIARSAGKPVVNASADATSLRFSKNAGFSNLASLFGGGGGAGGGAPAGGIALPGDSITTFAVGFDASWELDVFGGVRRSVEAARARADASVWSARDAQVMLAAEVARAYWQLRLDQAQVAAVTGEIARQERALAIAGRAAQVGLVPPIDVTRQRGQITANQARLPTLRADADRQLHAVAVLAGEVPGALLADYAADRLPPAMPVPVVPPGLPSELLRRRPDVRAAERDLAAATADIGVAVADLYPRFTLTGMAQLVSTSLATLFQGNSVQLTGSGAARFPLLDWGRRRATVRVREAQRDEAYQQYRATVLGALRDVEDALATLAAERERRAALAQAVADAETSTRAIEAQYRTGFVAQDSLLNSEAQLLQAREQLAGSDAQLRQATVALVKALGGGWDESAAAAP